LKGLNSAYYGNIGLAAVDLSINDGVYSTSTGAIGNYSHAESYGTTAGGDYSHAEGHFTIALNKAMHAAGKYNIGTATDTIHETGIGTHDYARANAFEIYTDGTLTAPEATNALIDARGAQAIPTVNWVQNNTASGVPEPPQDGKVYGRTVDIATGVGSWVEITGGTY